MTNPPLIATLGLLFASLASTCAAVADLSIVQSVSSPSMPLGATFTYTLTVQNAGPDQATDLVLTDILPAVVKLVSAQSDLGSVAQSGNTIACHLDSLASGSTATLTLAVTPTSSGKCCNFARVLCAQTDPSLTNNHCSICTSVTSPVSGSDLGVSTLSVPDPATVGSNVTYTIRVRNNGPDTASAITLLDKLPTNATLVSISPDCVESGGVVSCTIATLARNASVTRTVVLTPTAPGPLCHTTSILGSQSRQDNNNNDSCIWATAEPQAVADMAVVRITAPTTIILSAKKPSVTKLIAVQIQNRSPHAETISTLDSLVNLTVESLGLCANLVPELLIGPPQRKLPLTLKSKQILNVYFRVAFDTNSVNDPIKSSIKSPGHEDFRYYATVHHEAIDSRPDTHPADDFGPRSVNPPWELTPNPDGKLRDLGVGKLKSDHTFGADILTDLIAPGPGSSIPIPPPASNHPPVAVDDRATTTGTNILNVPLLANDNDPDGDPLAVIDFTQPSNGSVSLVANTARYTANLGFFGSDRFTYTISDGRGGNASGQVFITVSSLPNHPPVAANDTASTTGTNQLQIAVLANDTDPDNDTLVIAGFTQPANGQVSFNGNVALYTANPGFFGTNHFNYTISDGRGGTDTASVMINVSTLPNHPPIAVDDTASTTGTNPVQIAVLANDTDPEGDALMVAGFTQPPNGQVLFSGNVAVYTADPGFLGTNRFNYTISDGRGGNDTGHVTITVSGLPNHPPIAVDDAAAASGTNPVQIAVLANDSDPDSDALSVASFTQPADGFVRFENNIATYTANAGFVGTNTFQYTISDGRGGTAAASVVVLVTNTSPWETSEIGSVWSDDFNRAALGSNWIVLGGANVSLAGNELLFNHSNVDLFRQVYYQPWLTCSDQWTIRWRQRFGSLDATSYGVGVGIKNFQAAGGNDRGYNAVLGGVGAGQGRMQIERWDGGTQVPVVTGPAMALAAGDVVDCSLTRSGWTLTATAINRANAQVSTTTVTFSTVANLIAPTISRICFYPLGGTVYVDDVSFSINHRKPARFILIGASANDGYNASSFARTHLSIIQSNFSETICNDSSSYNTTSNSVSILPEILAHQPGTAILMIGGNDIGFGYPAAQWQAQFSSLVTQLQAASVRVKICLHTPRNADDLRPLNTWISAHYPAQDIIDIWTPMLQGTYQLNPIYDSGDGLHPNDAGHYLIGQLISAALR
jgi:uncharacterized repeat protein (TIGR01451 family)